ncbi:MAG: aminopeptidase [Thermoplasmata archaeon HGW-Thermoplasmata-1]|nr:MAG: aminopeptidase [Thermoplasmata archaeon HGW-Thermoplasmata-1]
MKKEVAWKAYKKADEREIGDFCEGYKGYLDAGKTERECFSDSLRAAEAAGFKPLEKLAEVKAGDRVYLTNRGKNLLLAVIGKKPMREGVNLVASHIDSPRLDLKQNPLYEEKELSMALLRTHYYGGIKKYQWGATPLALHGAVVLSDGKKVDVSIGEKEDEPVFSINDLLPHLSHKKADRKMGEVLSGEELVIIAASMPHPDKKSKSPVKLAVLEYLHENYGMTEEDFVSAEFEAVPVGKARDVGFDRSMVGAYGQDDRICAYTSLRAMLDMQGTPERTCVCFLADKEETGSDSNTGMTSAFMPNSVLRLLSKSGEGGDYAALAESLENSKCLSSDVNAAMDPNFKDVHEPQNASKLGFGVTVTKFTGSRGKSGANDSSAEFVGEIRRILNAAGVQWQTGELGRVDEGGGGTVAKFLAQYNMDVIDCGPAILSMHSPFEIASKADIYETYKAYGAFYAAPF